MSSGVTVQDSGVDRYQRQMEIYRELAKTKRLKVEIGILEETGKAKHGDDNATILEIAEVHEFGAVVQVAARDQTVRREAVMMDLKTRSYKGGKFVRRNAKRGYDTVFKIPAHEIVIPARSFIRATVDEKRREINAMVTKLLLQVVKGQLTAVDALSALGEFVVKLIRKRIIDGIAPPLSPATIRARAGGGKGAGGDTPLYDTGQLVRSITYRVVEK